jgi:hypothetical protein
LTLLGPLAAETASRGQRDRHEVVERVVGQVLVHELVHHQRRIDCHEQRVAVGRRLRRRLRADDGVGAGPVFDHHRLSPILAHGLADQARHDVAWTAGGEGHDHPDRPIGKARGLLLGSRRA